MDDVKRQDRLDRLDFTAITEEAVAEISSIPLVESCTFIGRRPVMTDDSPDAIRTMLLGTVWGKGIALLNSRRTEPMVAEKALSELIRRGVDKDRINCRQGSFRLRLENGRYRTYKNTETGAIYACPWPSQKRHEIRMSGCSLAAFILRFDAEIPQIVSHVPRILEVFGERKMEERRQKMEKELKEQVLKSLIEQYLEPLGLSARYGLWDGDMVSMDIWQTRSAHLEMPLCDLSRKLADADSVLASLKVEQWEGN